MSLELDDLFAASDDDGLVCNSEWHMSAHLCGDDPPDSEGFAPLDLPLPRDNQQQDVALPFSPFAAPMAVKGSSDAGAGQMQLDSASDALGAARADANPELYAHLLTFCQSPLWWT